MTERNSEEAGKVSEVLGARLLATANIEESNTVGVLVVSTLGPIQVDLYKSASDGSMVVNIETTEIVQDTALRVYLNDETIYDSSVSDELTETQGE